MKDVGTDSNVFNDAKNPRQDLTLTLSPNLLFGLRFRRLRLTGVSATDYVIYRKYREEWSTNKLTTYKLELLLDRFRPYYGLDFVSTRARRGYEIDTRARRHEPAATVGVDWKVGSRTTLSASAKRSFVRYAEGETFRGVSLRGALNQKTEAISGAIALVLSPFTTFAVQVEALRNRFDFSKFRNGDSMRVTPSLEFSPSALLSGRLAVGYRKYDAMDEDVPGYSGPVASIDLGYSMQTNTRFSFRADRDLAYSSEENEPYYVTTGGGVGVTQRLGGLFDIAVRADRHRLAYRTLSGTTEPDRVDTVDVVGGGIGYSMRGTRIGINYEVAQRRSNTSTDREYMRNRLYGSVDVGLGR